MDASRIAAIPLFSVLAPEQQAQLADVAEVGRGPAGDRGIDVEAAVQVEARLVDLGVERGDQELDAEEPRGRGRGCPEAFARADPPEDERPALGPGD